MAAARTTPATAYVLKPASMGVKIDVTNIGKVLDLLDQLDEELDS